MFSQIHTVDLTRIKHDFRRCRSFNKNNNWSSLVNLSRTKCIMKTMQDTERNLLLNSIQFGGVAKATKALWLADTIRHFYLLSRHTHAHSHSKSEQPSWDCLRQVLIQPEATRSWFKLRPLVVKPSGLLIPLLKWGRAPFYPTPLKCLCLPFTHHLSLPQLLENQKCPRCICRIAV